MTVAELIERLRELPQQSEVRFLNWDKTDGFSPAPIEGVGKDDKGVIIY